MYILIPLTWSQLRLCGLGLFERKQSGFLTVRTSLKLIQSCLLSQAHKSSSLHFFPVKNSYFTRFSLKSQFFSFFNFIEQTSTVKTRTLTWLHLELCPEIDLLAYDKNFYSLIIITLTRIKFVYQLLFQKSE